VVVAAVPFPLGSPTQATDAVLERVTGRSRVALLDHVTSPTGLVLPVEELVTELERRDVRVVVDGAHAPGMLPLSLDRLGASVYAGNCHKWLCAPKGAGFLWVRDDLRPLVRPLVVSHGASLSDERRPRFWLELDWTGTFDPSPWLAVPAAIRHLGAQLDGGWPELCGRNRTLALSARALLCEELRVAPPCPEGMIGSLAAVPLPDGAGDPPVGGTRPVQEALRPLRIGCR
jgi:isopenicillin-N epimerase